MSRAVRDGRVLTPIKSAERILGPTSSSSGPLRTGPLVSLIHEDGSPLLGHERPTMVSIRTGEPQHEVGVVRALEEQLWMIRAQLPQEGAA